MFILNAQDLESIVVRMGEIAPIESKMLEGFACSASDNGCGCGWDCSSEKT